LAAASLGDEAAKLSFESGREGALAKYERVFGLQKYDKLTEFPKPSKIAKIRRGFQQVDGVWQAKTFEGGGPLVAVFMPEDHSYLETVQKVFRPIVDEIKAVFEDRADEVQVIWTVPGEEHVIGGVVQEDKELLGPEEQADFVRVTDEEAAQVGDRLQPTVARNEVPVLGEIGHFIGSDGGMAAFLYDKNGAFSPLREAIADEAQEVVGEKNISRGKRCASVGSLPSARILHSRHFPISGLSPTRIPIHGER